MANCRPRWDSSACNLLDLGAYPSRTIARAVWDSNDISCFFLDMLLGG